MKYLFSFLFCLSAHAVEQFTYIDFDFSVGTPAKFKIEVRQALPQIKGSAIHWIEDKKPNPKATFSITFEVVNDGPAIQQTSGNHAVIKYNREARLTRDQITYQIRLAILKYIHGNVLFNR